MTDSRALIGRIACVLAVAPGVGCGGEAFHLDGVISSPTVADGTAVGVLWSADTVVYKFGGGIVSGGAFEITIEEDAPPDGARIDPALGIAQISALYDGVTLPDGALDKSEDYPIAATANVLIIWRGDGSPSLPWAEAFEAGYSCGRCVVQEAGKDTIEPAPCDGIDIGEAFVSCDFN